MIIVTGATGALNGGTVEHLLKLVPAERIGVSVRDVAQAQHLADHGVRVRRGSYDDPAALLDAFEGAEQVLLVSSNDPGADQVSLHRAAIEAAVTAGAGRVLYTSHQGAGADSPFQAGPRSRRDRSTAGGLRHRLDLAAQRLLRPYPRLAARPLARDRDHRGAGRRAGVVDRPRRPSRGGRRDPGRRAALRRPGHAHRGRRRDVR